MGDAYDLAKTFVHVGGDGATVPLEVTETFFQDLGSGTFGELGPGRLLSLLAFDAALSEPGTYVLIPRGTWHTATTSEPTRMLFLTDGEGTDHRPA